MRGRIVRNAGSFTEQTAMLQALKIGDRVIFENQTCNHSLRCDQTGIVIEVK